MRILYFAPIYYDDMKQRPQHLAECLSAGHEVYYIEPTISIVRWLIKRGRTYKGRVWQVNQHLTCIRLSGVFTFHKSIEILDLAGLNNWAEYIQIKQLAQKCDVIWAGYSGWYTLVRHFKGKPIVFDKMDEEDMLVSSGLWKMTLKRNQRKLLRVSDLAVVTCMKFYDEIRNKKKALLVPNAAADDFLKYLKKRSTCRTAEKKRRDIVVFGYIGTIGPWFDFEAVDYILNLDKKYYVVLAGRNMQPVFKHERVIYLGIRPYREMPDLIRQFDVCLYNFKQSGWLDTVNPVKIYEYLAAGRPVLAVGSRETRILEKQIMIYEKISDIKRLISNGWKQPFASFDEQLEFIHQNTWACRTSIIEKALRELVEGEK